MAVNILTLEQGDTTYILKHNTNYNNLKIAVEALQAAVGAGTDPGASVPIAYDAMFGPANAILGNGSYLPTQQASHTLRIAEGFAFLSGTDNVVTKASTTDLDFTGQTTGTHYVVVDDSGVPSRSDTSTGALYSVYYDSATGDFSSITRTANLVWTQPDWEDAQTDFWSRTVDSLDDRLTASEKTGLAILQKTVASSNITLTEAEAFEQALVLLEDGPQTANIELIVPNQSRLYRVLNQCSSSYTVTLKTSSGTGYAITGNHWALVYVDGTDAQAIFDLDLVGGGAPPSTFTDLTDTPNSFSGRSGEMLMVNAAEDGLEFIYSPYKMPVVVASTGNLTLSGEQTVDGVALTTGDRILVKAQTASEDNGIYVVATTAWSRSRDADVWLELVSAVVTVSDGSTHADTSWQCTVDAGGTLGTTAVNWAELGTTAWGDVTGTLSNQTDLQSALDAKLENITGEDFTDLSDTPANYSGAGSYTVKVNAGATALEFVNVSGSSYDFLGLADTPSSYTGHGSKFVKVNSTPDGLEFVADPGYLTAITGEDFVDLSDTPADYTGGVGGHAVKVNSGATALEFVDDPYLVSGFLPSSPGASAIMLVHVFAVAVDFPSGLTGSQGTAETAATAQTDIDIQKNGSSVGTMRFAAAATTASFIMATATSFAAGDKVQLVAPASPDSTLADIAYTLKGTR